MTNLRTLSTLSVAALLLAGCCTTSRHSSKKCNVCTDGTVYYDSTAPAGDPNAGVLMTPPPTRTPMPVPEAEPLPEVPPPPGTTEAPSRLRAMRDTTEGLFRTAGENVRAVFTR